MFTHQYLRWFGKYCFIMVFFIMSLISFNNHSFSQENPIMVDKKIVILLDSSFSMSMKRFQWQIDGYANALTDPEVIQMIKDGYYGKIAVSVIQFTENAYIIFDWTILDETNIHAFVNEFRNQKRANEGLTSISLALYAAKEMMQDARIQGVQNIIVLSADGVNNYHSEPYPLNEKISNYLKVTIVAIGIKSFAITPEELKRYLKEYVIYGPGKFLQMIEDEEDFKKAIVRIFSLNSSKGNSHEN